jgi:HSP20 family molecular chaperone IbpA
MRQRKIWRFHVCTFYLSARGASFASDEQNQQSTGQAVRLKLRKKWTYYPSTVGFDRLFDLLDKSIRSDWPPFNIEKKREDQRITMTIAGFAPDEIELVQHGSTLLVTGQKGEQPELLHQAFR